MEIFTYNIPNIFIHCSGKKLMDIYNLIKSKDVKIKVAGGNVKNVFEGKKYD